MPDASPIKWHLAHTTWFFETFILAQHETGFSWHNPSFQTLFNSYYNGIGEQHPRPERGMLSRPGLDEIHSYRTQVNERLEKLLANCDTGRFELLAAVLVLGINHEQQHQELILTDIKHALFQNPCYPAYAEGAGIEVVTTPAQWLSFGDGTYRIGHQGTGFCFDNELPAHRILIRPFEICSRAVTNADWLEFMDDGGYQQALLWLSDGWAWKQQQGIAHPCYWVKRDNQWWQFSLRGLIPLQAQAPVCHVSYYEAEAFARWQGGRLPTEAECEVAAGANPDEFAVRDDGAAPAETEFHHSWRWTSSAYSPYPGYCCPVGAVGEYNGKFMVNQMVLRGSSCATPSGHSRISYRNFFHPHARWQFNGLSLARNV